MPHTAHIHTLVHTPIPTHPHTNTSMYIRTDPRRTYATRWSSRPPCVQPRVAGCTASGGVATSVIRDIGFAIPDRIAGTHTRVSLTTLYRRTFATVVRSPYFARSIDFDRRTAARESPLSRRISAISKLPVSSRRNWSRIPDVHLSVRLFVKVIGDLSFYAKTVNTPTSCFISEMRLGYNRTERSDTL